MNAPRQPVDWHWPRTALAEHYVRMFQMVGAHSMVLFAPRGKGKTQFMTRDVQPAAEAAGMFPVYVNFWDDNSSPASSMRYAILRAADEAGLLQRMRAALARAKPELTFGLALGVAKLDLKTKFDRKPEESLLFDLRQITDSLIKHSGKKLLFIFDEVQTLAIKAEHETFIRSLRTLLDERRPQVCSIFTGSSQSRLTELFSRIKSPLYNFAQQQEFPALGDGFLKHWLANIEAIMGSDPVLNLDRMREAFVLTERNPRIFWAAVMEMIQTNTSDIVTHTAAMVRGTGELSGMRQRVAELSVLDKAVLQEIVVHTLALRHGGPALEPLQLFSGPARERIGKFPGMTPTTSQVQGALKRLMATDTQLVVMKGRGEYEIEDPFFLQWFQEELLGVSEPLEAMSPVEPAVVPKIEG